MKTNLVKIGNSRGIRLPKPLIEQCGFENEVEMEVQDHTLIIRSASEPRKGWDAAFTRMNKCSDDSLQAAEPPPSWDEEEWQW